MDYLSNVNFDKALRIREGVFVHNYKELLTELQILNDKEFADAFNGGRAIISWISENQKDEYLLSRLEIARTKREFARLIGKRIAQLEFSKAKLNEKTEKIDFNSNKIRFPIYVNILFFFLFIVVIFGLMHYVFENDEDSSKNYILQNQELKSQLDIYADRIAFLERQNLELQSNLSIRQDEIMPLEAAMPTPRDRIGIENIGVDNSEVRILIENAYLAGFESTGSMLPLLGSKTTGIQIKVEEESDIYPGDIISYRIEDNLVIIHRVIEIGYDEQGWYAITKGDNNYFKDKEKVRFHQVERVLIGIIY